MWNFVIIFTWTISDYRSRSSLVSAEYICNSTRFCIWHKVFVISVWQQGELLSCLCFYVDSYSCCHSLFACFSSLLCSLMLPQLSFYVGLLLLPTWPECTKIVFCCLLFLACCMLLVGCSYCSYCIVCWFIVVAVLCCFLLLYCDGILLCCNAAEVMNCRC